MPVKLTVCSQASIHIRTTRPEKNAKRKPQTAKLNTHTHTRTHARTTTLYNCEEYPFHIQDLLHCAINNDVAPFSFIDATSGACACRWRYGWNGTYRKFRNFATIPERHSEAWMDKQIQSVLEGALLGSAIEYDVATWVEFRGGIRPDKHAFSRRARPPPASTFLIY